MLALWGWLLVAAALPRVSILVQPRIVDVASHWLRIECRVRRHPENRLLRIGVADLTESARLVDGELDRVIHELVVHTIASCEDMLAYCVLEDASHERYVASQRVPVFGCGDNL